MARCADLATVLLAGLAALAAPAAAMEFRASGLTAVLPPGCPEIASPFASPTRYDGSHRPQQRFGGLHGGIDISLPEGTPLLALAAGKVVGAGTGGMAEGHYLWLQHAPQDTGLPFWVYAKYQHFRELPEHAVGTTLRLGQVVGRSGLTGTQGRHYGPAGYPHLHLTIFAGGSERYETLGSAVRPEHGRIVDPVAIYLKGLAGIADLERLSANPRNVAIPYASTDGTVHPAGSLLVWPVACKVR